MNPKLRRFLKWEAPYLIIIAIEIVVIARHWILAVGEPSPRQKTAQAAAVIPPNGSFVLEEIKRARVESPGYLLLACWLVFALLVGGIIGAALLAAAIYYKIGGRALIPQQPLLTPRWRIWDVVKVAALVPFYMVLSLRTLQLLARIGWASHRDPAVPMLTTEICYRIMGTMLIFWVVGAEHGQGLRDLGLHARRWAHNVWLGVASYLAVLPIILIIMVVTALLIPYFPVPPQVPPVISESLSRSGGVLFLLFVLAAVAAPISEEIFFRGLMQPALRARIGAALSIVVTALIFALLHMSLWRFVPIFVLGVIFGYVAERTQSLLPSITMHIIHNTAFITLALCVQRLLKTT